MHCWHSAITKMIILTLASCLFCITKQITLGIQQSFYNIHRFYSWTLEKKPDRESFIMFHAVSGLNGETYSWFKNDLKAEVWNCLNQWLLLCLSVYGLGGSEDQSWVLVAIARGLASSQYGSPSSTTWASGDLSRNSCAFMRHEFHTCNFLIMSKFQLREIWLSWVTRVW